jgi:hypothetical protein
MHLVGTALPLLVKMSLFDAHLDIYDPLTYPWRLAQSEGVKASAEAAKRSVTRPAIVY